LRTPTWLLVADIWVEGEQQGVDDEQMQDYAVFGSPILQQFIKFGKVDGKSSGRNLPPTKRPQRTKKSPPNLRV